MNWDAFLAQLVDLRLIDYGLLALSIAFISFSKLIVVRLSDKKINKKTLNLRTALLRGINVGFVAYYLFRILSSHNNDNTIAYKAISILGIIYFSYLANYVLHYLIFYRYGKSRTVGGTTTYIETYQSRAFSLLTTLITSVIGLIWVLHTLGFDELTEAGGALGIIGVMIGLTQGSWAPDIISGLILLHSDVFEEGDVIEMENGTTGLVYKTKMFHTEILNMTNNHRIMVRNARLRDLVIHNLSKFASAKGLRESLSFKIGYDVSAEAVKRMFNQAHKNAIGENIGFEQQHDVEIKLLDTGDHALTWAFIYYVKNIESLVQIRRDMREAIFKTSIACNISLATPLTHQGDMTIRSNSPITGAEPEMTIDPNAQRK